MDRLLTAAPRGAGLLAAVVVALRGAVTSWEMAASGRTGGWVAALGVLLLVRPLLALLAAWVNHLAVDLLLTPARRLSRDRGPQGTCSSTKTERGSGATR